MKQYIRNADLMMIMQDIDHWMHVSPAFAIFNGPKVKRFNEQNRIRIQSLEKAVPELIDKYVQKDEAGKPEMMLHDGKQKFRFKSDEDEKKYEEEYKVLMDKGFDVEL